MKRVIMALLILLYVMLPSYAVFAQTAEDAGLASEISADRSASEGSEQVMENEMDTGATSDESE